MLSWRATFEAACTYGEFLDRFASDAERRAWADAFDGFVLTTAQRALLDTFVRDMNVICLAGAWCGDCVRQCPIFEHITRACRRVNVRYLDRDADDAVRAALSICGGHRVPVVVFLSEDFAECARYGDRTLSRYRALAAEQFGATCPTGVPAARSDIAADVVADWLREFERIQLMLRLSPRLREKHGD
ncbi:MAG: thioredoxin family protein [Phycisphaerae bacterium]